MGEGTSSPHCTHVDMDRVYGHDQRCCVCGCLASIGFLYQCRQDSKAMPTGGLVSQDTERIGPAKSTLRNELERSGFSESIIVSAEDGHYTSRQLQKLKQLKRELQHTIIDVEQAYRANDAIARLVGMSMAVDSPGEAVDSSLRANTGRSKCTFKACHACRPYYLDRSYISFQAAVTTDFPPMTQADIAKLPVKSAAIIRNMNTIGQRLSTGKTPRLSTTSNELQHSISPKMADPSERTFRITQADIEQSVLQRRPHMVYYKAGRHPSCNLAQDPYRQSSLRRTQGFKTAIQGILRYHREPSTSIPSVPHPVSGTVGGFDTDEARRARRERMRQQLLKTKTSVESLAKATRTGHVGKVNVERRDSSIKPDPRFQIYSLEADAAEDAELRLTAARTQVARMHSPNIVSIRRSTSSPRPRKPESLPQHTEVGQRDKESSNNHVGLQSIMAQV